MSGGGEWSVVTHSAGRPTNVTYGARRIEAGNGQTITLLLSRWRDYCFSWRSSLFSIYHIVMAVAVGGCTCEDRFRFHVSHSCELKQCRLILVSPITKQSCPSLSLSDRNFSKAEQRQRRQQQQHAERKVNEMKRRTVVGEAVRRSASSPSLPRPRLSRHLPPLRPSFLISPAAPYAYARRGKRREDRS